MAGEACRGGTGALVAPMSIFREGRLGGGRIAGVGPLVGGLGGGAEGLAGAEGRGGFCGGTLRVGGVGDGDGDEFDFGTEGALPRVGGMPSGRKLQS